MRICAGLAGERAGGRGRGEERCRAGPRRGPGRVLVVSGRAHPGRRWLVPASLVLVLAWVAGCTGSPPAATGSPSAATGSSGGGHLAFAARTLLASRGRLVDRPVQSGGCGRRPPVRPGTTAQLTVAVPPAAAAGAHRRSYLLHVPADYAPGTPTPLIL